MRIEQHKNSTYVLTDGTKTMEEVESFLENNTDNYENLAFIEKDEAVARLYEATECFIFHNEVTT